jgi:hypothetical protein
VFGLNVGTVGAGSNGFRSLTCDDRTHSTTIELIEPAPPEVAAGAAITLKVKASCSRGCDLTGMPIKIVAADGAPVRSEFATELGPDDIAEVKLEAPDRTGEHVWSMTFGPHEVAGVRHDEVTVPVRTAIIPHATSLAVWSVPSPVVTGARFVIAVGAKSSAGISFAAEHVEIRDEFCDVVAQGCLGETPYPGTTALYWTSIELAAPSREGLHTWSVEFEPREPDLPHERGSTTFSVLVVRPPEHRLTIKVIEKDTSAPIADAQVRLGAYRAATDPLGLAEVDMPTGVYDLDIWKVGYEAPTRTVRLEKNMLVEVEALSVHEEDPDAAWLM